MGSPLFRWRLIALEASGPKTCSPADRQALARLRSAPGAQGGLQAAQEARRDHDALERTIARKQALLNHFGTLKEIERAGIPVVHIATVVPISLTIGANRIVPAVGIPYPLGDPGRGEETSKKIRRELVERALKALMTPVEDQTVFE